MGKKTIFSLKIAQKSHFLNKKLAIFCFLNFQKESFFGHFFIKLTS